MVEQIFLSPQVKRSAITGNKLYIRVASRVVKQLETYDMWKLEKIKKIYKLHRIIPYC